MAEYRYKAFVSYSWADAKWGKWLLHAIETYRTPGALIGKDGLLGPVPARLHPLFKDREEEAAGASIGQAVEHALENSEFLIVICSPRSAQSKWVNHELAWFKTHRDPAKILALIVDGVPGSGDELECFPAALTHRVAPDMRVTDEPVDAPLAADARVSGDGKRRARLKLVAAMLGVGLDELVGRDDRRRTIRTRLVVGASLALALVMSGMAWAAVVARNEADRQRAESDGLVEFMLTDLRERLQPVGRLDALDVVGKRALKYYAGQKASSLDADALGRRARALHLVGEVSNIRGDSVAALGAFRQAAATTGELLARDPDNPQRIFDHAQSVFWVGYIAYERKEVPEAEREWREYKRLADQLVALNPAKLEWQMEVSYAESNLGVLFYDQGRNFEAEPAFAKALSVLEAVAAKEKPSASRQLEMGNAINWLGKARLGLNRTTEALALHKREIAIYQQVLRSDPLNTQAKMREAVAWQHVGIIAENQGEFAASATAYENSRSLLKALRLIEPGNTEWQEIELRAIIGQLNNLYYRQDIAGAELVYREAKALLAAMMSADPKNTIWSIELQSSLDVYGGRLALARGNSNIALSLAQGVLRRFAGAKSADGEAANQIKTDAEILVGDALVGLGRKAEALALWKAGLDRIVGNDAGLPSRTLRSRFLLLKRLGRPAEAAKVAQMLDRQGYRHPAYLREKSLG